MPRPKKNKDLEIIAKKIPAVVREEIRNAIRLDSSTLLKKQMVLKEAVRSEDNRRLEFIKQRLKMETKSLPINILKLIGSLKKAVRQTMRYKGGTPFSIIRELFIYWDADKVSNFINQLPAQLLCDHINHHHINSIISVISDFPNTCYLSVWGNVCQRAA